MNCGTCRFSSPEIVAVDDTGNDNPTPVLLCHRYPPQMLTAVVAGTAVMAFPQVVSTDWCGEWQPPEPEYAGTGGEQ